MELYNDRKLINILLKDFWVLDFSITEIFCKYEGHGFIFQLLEYNVQLVKKREEKQPPPLHPLYLLIDVEKNENRKFCLF